MEAGTPIAGDRSPSPRERSSERDNRNSRTQNRNSRRWEAFPTPIHLVVVTRGGRFCSPGGTIPFVEGPGALGGARASSRRSRRLLSAEESGLSCENIDFSALGGRTRRAWGSMGSVRWERSHLRLFRFSVRLFRSSGTEKPIPMGDDTHACGTTGQIPSASRSAPILEDVLSIRRRYAIPRRDPTIVGTPGTGLAPVWRESRTEPGAPRAP